MQQKSYSERHQENKQRLITLLHMRRAGKGRTAAYKQLNKLAMQQHHLLTAEALEQHRTNKLKLN